MTFSAYCGKIVLTDRQIYMAQQEEIMYKIYIIEDDEGIATAVSKRIESWGMEARIASDFRNITSEFAEYAPELVLLDIALPYMNGYHWCLELRKISRVPIIIISSASDNMNIVMAMNMGADDFIAKPFDENVLIAKIQAMLRRTYDFTESAPVLEHHGVILNTGDNTLYYNDQKLSLSKNEYRILFELMRSKGRIVSRERLMEALWQTDEFVDENALSVNVGRLRKKLESIGLSGFIETKFGSGYIINL